MVPEFNDEKKLEILREYFRIKCEELNVDFGLFDNDFELLFSDIDFWVIDEKTDDCEIENIDDFKMFLQKQNII